MDTRLLGSLRCAFLVVIAFMALVSANAQSVTTLEIYTSGTYVVSSGPASVSFGWYLDSTYAQGSGVIDFFDGTSDIAEVSVSYSDEPGAIGSVDLTLTPGVHVITAQYTGDPAPATSSAVTFTVYSGTPPLVSTYTGPTTVTFGTPVTPTGKLGAAGETPAPTGTVVLLDEHTQISNTTTLSGAAPFLLSAVVDTSTVGPGVYQFEWSYSGDAYWAPATVFTTPITVQGSAALSLSYAGPAIVPAGGVPVALTGKLSESYATVANQPSGTVSLLKNGTPIASVTLNSGNSLPYSLNFTVNTLATALQPGTDTLTLSYSGDNLGWLPATSNPVVISVTPVPAIALTSNLVGNGTVISGTPVKVTANVTSIGNGPAPTGTVQFYDGSTAIGAPVPVQAEAAAYVSTAFAVGTHAVTAVYSGDSLYSSLTSSPLTFTTISQSTDTLSITSTGSSPSVTGYPFTITGKVQPPPLLGPAISGTVALLEDGISIASQTTTGSAAFTVNTVSAPLVAGMHSFTLSYSGDAHYAASTSSAVVITLVQGSISLLLTDTGASSVPAGTGIYLKATLTKSQTGPSLTGILSLLEDGNAISTVTPTGTGPYTYTFSVNLRNAPFAAGPHTLALSYSGDPNWMTSSSTPLNITITGILPSLTLTSNADNLSNVVQGTSLIFTASVGTNSGLPEPTGTVQFYVDNATAGSPVTLSNDAASYTVFNLGIGQHSIASAYSGNSIYSSISTTNTVVTVVTQGSDAIALSLSGASTVSPGNPATLTGDLQVESLGPAPTGSINLLDGGNVIVSKVLAGSAPFNFSFQVNTATEPLSVGVHSFTLEYPGSAQWASAASTAQALTVEPTTASTGLQFIPVTPCRIVDTRWPTGPFGGPEMAAGTSRSFNIPQSACGIPSTAVAYSLNVTVVPDGFLNYLTLWPTGETQPYVSTLNSDGRVKANAAITPAGTNGGVSVYVSDATNVILDIDGYFVPAGTASALAFYPVTPCRVADTRKATGPLGGPSISGGSSRSFPVQSSSCDIPATAKAYSLNVTAVPHKTLNYLTTWPTGETQPYVSTLNSSTGAVTANAAVVPAGTSGAVSIFVSDTSDVILDVNGYFAPPATGGLSLYPVTPCRVIDTRSGAGAFNGVLAVDVETSSCAPPSTAQGYVLNATVVPPGSLDYLTLWPAGEAQPYVSTLNALDGAITSNMAIVPTTNGSIDAFSSNPTNLILDLSGYFAP